MWVCVYETWYVYIRGSIRCLLKELYISIWSSVRRSVYLSLSVHLTHPGLFLVFHLRWKNSGTYTFWKTTSGSKLDILDFHGQI